MKLYNKLCYNNFRSGKMKKYKCQICGYIYDDAKEEIKFADLPNN